MRFPAPDFHADSTYHEHPIKILQYSAKNIWLLIFPLLRSLRFYPFSFQNFLDWGAGAWLDLLVALLILCIGVLRWYCCSIRVDAVSIQSSNGILLQQKTEIPFSRITATVEEHPVYLRPFHAVRLQISTASGVVPEANMKLILYGRDLRQIRRQVPVLHTEGERTDAHPMAAWRVVIFSALFSSSFSGAIYIAALFVQGGRITSDLLAEFQARQILEDATDRASTMFQGVPRIAITIGILIFALWLISFGRNLLRYGRFRIRFSEDFISVHMGILNRRRFHLRDSAIVFPDLRQNLVMKIFGVVSLHIRCPGYGSRRDTLPVLIPLVRERTSRQLLEKFHAPKRLPNAHLKAKSRPQFFWSFVWPPVIGLGILILIRLVTLRLFPQVEQMIRFFAIMLALPLVWFLTIRIISLFTQYVSMDDHDVQMHFSRGTIFHTITVPRSRIVRADLIQTPVQKQYGVCHLYLVCNGPRQQRFKLTALPEQAARTIIAALTQPEEVES